MESLGLFEEMLKLVAEYFYSIMHHYWRIEGYKWKSMNVDPQILRFKRGQDLRLHHDFCSITLNAASGCQILKCYNQSLNCHGLSIQFLQVVVQFVFTFRGLFHQESLLKLTPGYYNTTTWRN